MARKSNTAGAGHNSDVLTEDEIAALQLWFSNRIRAARKEAEVAKAAYDVKREAVNGFFSQARGELKMTRKEFEEVLALQDLTEAEFLHHETKRQARMRFQGLPVGEQIELPLGDTADDLARARADGYRAGMRGDDGVAPDHVSPVCLQDWLGGWSDGQAKLAEGLGKAAAIMEARKPKSVELQADDEGEADPDEIEDGLDDEARRLKRAGWADRPTGDETSFGEAA
jgi:ribosome modulation factor